MTARVIDGKALAADFRQRIGAEVQRIEREYGTKPGLAVVLVGYDPASQIYVRNKGKQAIEAGIKSIERKLSADVSEAELLELIVQLNNDPEIHGILVQLPLPAHINANVIIDAIDPCKDVDGFHITNAGALATGRKEMVPCTPLGCLMLLRNQLGSLAGLHAVVVGRSNIVGKPMAQLLLGEDCTVTIAHSRTKDLAKICQSADILIAAAGRPNLIDGAWVKPGATVIDVGINKIECDGKSQLVGDVKFSSVSAVAGAITPVPGGVGPMTIACLLANTLFAFCHANSIPKPANLTNLR